MRLRFPDHLSPGTHGPAHDHGQLSTVQIDDATDNFICLTCPSGLVLHLTVVELKLLLAELTTKVKGLTVEGL